MKEKTYGIIFIVIAAALLTSFTAAIARAASIADNLPSQANKSLSVSGTTEPSVASSNNGSGGLILTAVPDRGIVAAGDAETIHVKATTNNGTGISDLMIQALVMDYATGKQRVILGGQTNEKGELDLIANIGPHAKSGQFFVAVNATKNDLKSSIATGFAVNEKGSSSSGSSGMKTDSKGRCSGSSCR